MDIIFALGTMAAVFALPTLIVCWLVAKPPDDPNPGAVPSAASTEAPHS
jgi:hypothetical protein